MSTTAKNLMTPITVDTLKLTSGATPTPEAKRLATEKVLADLMVIRNHGDQLQILRASLAQHVWEARLCFTFVGKDKVKRPDWNGQSTDYGTWYRALMVKAGFKITETMTPYEVHNMKLARQQVGAAIRYEVRRIADRTLTAAQLRAAGFHFSSALGDDQKLSEDADAAPARVRKISVADMISNAIAELTNASTRPQDVRDLEDAEKADLLEKLAGVAGIVARLLAPSATNEVPTTDLAPLLEESAKQATAKRAVRAKVTS